MGALAVVLSRAGRPDPDTVRRMLAAAPHRGTRCEVEAIGQTAVGICNDPEWTTASLSRDEERLVAFCGALDNEAEIRTQLGRTRARETAASSPAATLLAAFRTWGEDAVHRLRGSFAGVVTDGREVLCFRDHFGARPMFVHDGPRGFFGATEVKQVLAGAGIPREPDVEYVHGILFGGVDRNTAFRGVERIPQKSLVTAGPAPGLRVRPYWDPRRFVETARLSFDEAVEGTRAALETAVGRMLTGRDVLLLSGGLDSPALAAMAVRVQDPDAPVQALTSVYPDHPTVDEREWTRMAAEHVGMPLHHYVARAGSLDDVERWVGLLDGPIDVVSIPESAESYTAARALGGRTVLNGEIAEILFESRAYLLDHLLSHARLRAAARLIREWRSVGRRPGWILRQAIRAVAAPRLAWRFLTRQPRRRRGLPAWVDERQFDPASGPPPLWSLNPRRRWIEMQTMAFRGPSISFEADEICAAVNGVDSRRPFADVDLWEFVLSLPAEVKFPHRKTKPLLREAMRGILPDALIDRKDKTYFDEFHLAHAAYPELRRLVLDSPPYLRGIDYRLLGERLAAEEMRIYELQWARNVARIHAFLNQWR